VTSLAIVVRGAFGDEERTAQVTRKDAGEARWGEIFQAFSEHMMLPQVTHLLTTPRLNQRVLRKYVHNTVQTDLITVGRPLTGNRDGSSCYE
jgi:hypothetical protein